MNLYINDLFKSYSYQSTETNGSYALLGGGSSIADGIRWFFSRSRRNQSGLAVDETSKLLRSSSSSSSVGSNDINNDGIGVLLSTAGDDRNKSEVNVTSIHSESNNFTADTDIIPGGDSMVCIILESNMMINNSSSNNTLGSFNSSQHFISTKYIYNWLRSLNGYNNNNTDSSYYNNLINLLNEVSSRVVSYCTGSNYWNNNENSNNNSINSDINNKNNSSNNSINSDINNKNNSSNNNNNNNCSISNSVTPSAL